MPLSDIANEGPLPVGGCPACIGIDPGLELGVERVQIPTRAFAA